MPEYFEDYSTMPSCNYLVKELTHTTAGHKDWSVFLSWEMTLRHELTTCPSNVYSKPS